MDYVRLSEVAKELGVSAATVRRYLEPLGIDPFRTVGGLILLTQEQARLVVKSLAPKPNSGEKTNKSND